MSDALTNLLTANRSSTVLQGIANPPQFNPLAAMTSAASTAGAIYDIRTKQAQQAWGQALQQATDANGNVDYPLAQSIAAKDPLATMGMATNLRNNAELQSAQIANAANHQRLLGVNAMSIARDSSDDNVNASFDNLIANGVPSQQVEAERQRWLGMSKVERQQNAVRVGLTSLDQLHQVIGQTVLQNTGNQVSAITGTQPTIGPNGQIIPGTVARGGGSVPLGMSPEDANQIVQVPYPKFLEDGKTPNPNYGKTFPMRKGDVIPLLTTNPGAGGGAAGLPPSLRNPANANQPPATPPSSTTPPTTTPAPAPSGAPTGTPPAGPPVSAGAAIAGPATLPLPPTPPAGGPPPVAAATPPPSPLPAPAGAVWNPNNPVGTSTVAPGVNAAAAAAAQSKATGRPVPVPGGNGLVAKPDGTVGPLPYGPRADISGGVPVASANALAPNLGAPSAPSPAVAGDVNAMLAGMQRGATPATGTAAAGPAATTYFGTAPSAADIDAQKQQVKQGMDEFQNISNQAVASRPRSAILGNMLADTSQFTTGPLASRIATVRNWANAVGIPVNTEGLSAQESLNKFGAQLANAQGAGSDTRMNVNIAANPHQELSPAGIDLMLRQLQGNEDYLQARAKLAASYGDQTDIKKFENDVGSKVDPRAFQFARMTPEQRQTYDKALSTRDRAAVRSSYNWLTNQGLLGN